MKIGDGDSIVEEKRSLSTAIPSYLSRTSGRKEKEDAVWPYLREGKRKKKRSDRRKNFEKK